MHRGRYGGNARKRKAKLTDATFQAMIGRAGAADASIATLDPNASAEDTVLNADGTRVRVGVALAQQARRAPARPFCCQDYHFGYITCGTCQSDQAFYVHQADLAQGYTFRCRICRHELTISAER